MPNRTNDVKLHTTFMNIAYRKNDNNITITDKNILKKFDATQILNVRANICSTCIL